jgi:hypothetical protein
MREAKSWLVSYHFMPIPDRREEKVDQKGVLVENILGSTIDLLANAEEGAGARRSSVNAIFDSPGIAPNKDISIGHEDTSVNHVAKLWRKPQEIYEMLAHKAQHRNVRRANESGPLARILS